MVFVWLSIRYKYAVTSIRFGIANYPLEVGWLCQTVLFKNNCIIYMRSLHLACCMPLFFSASSNCIFPCRSWSYCFVITIYKIILYSKNTNTRGCLSFLNSHELYFFLFVIFFICLFYFLIIASNILSITLISHMCYFSIKHSITKIVFNLPCILMYIILLGLI